jgi:hypothetical protein
LEGSDEKKLRGARILRLLSGSGLVGRAMRLGVVGGGQQKAGSEGGDA